MNRTIRVILAIFFVAVIAISAISITQNLTKPLRLDITDQRLYVLSDGTKAILAGLQQPITVKLFYTKTAANKAPDQIRVFNTYYSYVKALLEEYVAQSKGKLKLEIIDPRPYSDEEMAAIRYGIRRFSITQEENFFFGLVVQTQFGATKVIDFFSPDRQQFVEYDISYLIDTAVTRQKKRIGVLSSLPVMGQSDYMARMMQMQGQQPKQKWGILAQLERNYEVVDIPVETETIENIDTLLVIHPKDLSRQTQFAIDQFILKGGRAIVMVDPHCVVDVPDQMSQMRGAQVSTASNVPALLRAWGLEMPANTFAGDRELAVEGATAPNRRPEKIIGILRLAGGDKGCFNKDHVAAANLNEVTVMFPGALKKLESSEGQTEELTLTPILTTTEKGNTWKVSGYYELMMPDYTEFMRRFVPGTKPVVMGYHISGMFRSAFPEGIDVEAESADDGENADSEPTPKTRRVTGLTEAAEPGAVVVLADVDMISDIVAYQRTFLGLVTAGDNSALLLNILEDFAGSANLISIRSRGNYKRPFTRVDEIEAEADAATAEEEAKIVAQIKEFERQLNERLRSLEGDNKGELINQTIVEEKKDIELKLLEAEKHLRDVKMQKRERLEALKVKLRNFCTLPGPVLILLVAVGLWLYRGVRRRYYVSHASDA